MANKITGTAGNDSLTGTPANDELEGLAGNDTLNGGFGKDTLDGGAGNDLMIGGLGQDTYHVDAVGDKVVEKASEGYDEVISRLVNYTLGANLDQLTLSLDAVNGRGNTLANRIYGNGDRNTLDGGAGNDEIQGHWGDDTLIGGVGNDSLYGETLNDSLNGGAGNDKLFGGAGNDIMEGGTGNDTYFIDADDTIIEKAKGGIDTIVVDVADYSLVEHNHDNIENLGTTLATGSSLTGNHLNNRIEGNDGADTLDGGAGNDTLDGGLGGDRMTGSIGNDVYYVDSTSDVVVEDPNEGIDEIRSSISLTLGNNIENLTLEDGSDGTGNGLNNVITGNASGNVLDGGEGDDTLIGGDGSDHFHGRAGKDVLIGGTGNDFYNIDGAEDTEDKIVEKVNEGRDTVRVVNLADYTLAANVEDLVLLDGAFNGTGNTLANAITGNAENNILNGGAGNDTLFGGLGVDTLIGGAGNDIYKLFGFLEDKIEETAKGGIDTIVANFTVDLSAVGFEFIENVFLEGLDNLNATGNALNNHLVGNDGANVLKGDVGNDTLDGGVGNDHMTGGTGNDVYHVDSVDDVVVEAPDQGIDEIRTSVDLDLSDNQFLNIESLTLLEGSLVGRGNDLNNVITGNAGGNFIFGVGGNDTLLGGDGGDFFIGGSEKDVLIGGAGDDRYDIFGIDKIEDKIIEKADEGQDIVVFYGQAGFTDYTLAANVERLTLANGAINGTGNALANTMFGNAVANTLKGEAGSDTINGGAGADTVIGGSGDDWVYGGEGAESDSIDGGTGNDTLDGGTGADTLIGGAGNDSLNGGAGNDILNGGAGNDTYVIDGDDTIIETAKGGIDTIKAAFNINLDDASGEFKYIEHVVLELGSSNLNAFGNALNNRLDGDFGNNVLGGKGGNDTLNGGAGNDALTGGDGNDSLSGGFGFDSLDGGAGNDSLSGGTASDTLDGGTGDDTLDGGGGADTMRGGTGNDAYVISSALDVVVENANEGIDELRAVDLAFTTLNTVALLHIENLTLLGSSKDASGNGLNNVITGNNRDNQLDGLTGNDTLNGGLGHDVLVGGAGNDLMIGGEGVDNYYVDSAGDKVVELANQGGDFVLSSLETYTLGANLENLILESGAVVGIGNALDNEITGNDLDNKLDGGGADDFLEGQEGADTLLGGAGDDWLDGGTENDSLDGGAGNDTLDGSDGADILKGGAGNDVYELGGINEDTIEEAAKGGIDTIKADFDVNLNTFQNVENVILQGNDNWDATGNALNNHLVGNDGANVLKGDVGNDTLDGGAGNDQMEGGAGNDVYYVDAAQDVVVEAPDQGIDEIRSSISLTLGDDIENLTLTGNASINGTGNGLNNVIKGSEGNNSLNGGAGNDQMIGGKGDDTYFVDSVGDKIVELANQGIDTVRSSIENYTLGATLENLVLGVGSNAVVGTGNALANEITGNENNNTLNGAAGDDTLDGGAGGADTLNGGAGNDVYELGTDAGDTIVETATGGIDTIKAEFTVDLNDTQFKFIENVTLLGMDDLNATGNALNNRLVGNAGANSLDGGAGNDTLDGGLGADTLTGGAGNDHFVFREADLPNIAGDTITDFEIGKDRLNLAYLFDTFGLSSIVDPVASGHLLKEIVGNDVVIKFDSDGGGDNFIVLATLQNIADPSSFKYSDIII